MLISRSKAAPAAAEAPARDAPRTKKEKKLPQLETFLEKRDYVGALTLLEFAEGSGKPMDKSEAWKGYCYFHLGEYQKALKLYKAVVGQPNCDPQAWVYLGCCCFYLGMYEEAEAAALKGSASPLQNRLLFHVSHKMCDEKRLMSYHKDLQDVVEDHLALASMHYLRSHFQEASEIYKQLLLEYREYAALQSHLALCHYKLDFYDIAQEVNSVYLNLYPTSTTGLNLKACIHYKLYNGKSAEAELKVLQEKASASCSFAQDLIQHNLVVFRDGEGALQVLPKLLDVVPEARLNLIIYHLRQGDLDEAYELVRDLDPAVPAEYILKGVVNACIGQEQNADDHLKLAQQYFQLVGGSASEMDTIPGRQCMASCFMLMGQHDDVLVYLNSIKSYFYNDDAFNFNYGQTLAATASWKEAEEAFLLIQSEQLKSDYTYLSWLARCYMMNRKPRLAWELYLKMETSGESFMMLQLLANDCFKMGAFYYAAKAFDVLERLDPNPTYWAGKRGASVGVFQQIVAGREPKESLREVITMLQSSKNPQVAHMTAIMSKWAKEKRVPLL